MVLLSIIHIYIEIYIYREREREQMRISSYQSSLMKYVPRKKGKHEGEEALQHIGREVRWYQSHLVSSNDPYLLAMHQGGYSHRSRKKRRPLCTWKDYS
jgi:hypothetical protein